MAHGASVLNTLLCFQSTFFEATCIPCFYCYVSAEIPRYEVFSHPSQASKHFFGRFKSVLRSVNETQVITHKKKKEKHDVSLIHCFLFERVSLIYCFTFFRNQLWRHLISHDNFINMNMCLLEVAMCERHRRSHFQSFEDWWKGG